MRQRYEMSFERHFNIKIKNDLRRQWKREKKITFLRYSIIIILYVIGFSYRTEKHIKCEWRIKSEWRLQRSSVMQMTHIYKYIPASWMTAMRCVVFLWFSGFIAWNLYWMCLIEHRISIERAKRNWRNRFDFVCVRMRRSAIAIAQAIGGDVVDTVFMYSIQSFPITLLARKQLPISIQITTCTRAHSVYLSLSLGLCAHQIKFKFNTKSFCILKSFAWNVIRHSIMEHQSGRSHTQPVRIFQPFHRHSSFFFFSSCCPRDFFSHANWIIAL